MHKLLTFSFGAAALALAITGVQAQQTPPPPATTPQAGPPQEKARPIENGGIFVDGWMGKVDANAEAQGQGVKDSRFAKEGDAFHVTTGPAITYWSPKMKLSGDYTVSATFTEPKYMNRNTHPHPYGIVIAGNDMGTAEETDLYCAAYGNGNFIVRGFGPTAFQMNGRRGEANDAVHKAPGVDQPVTQTIAMQVKGDKVSCIINGTEVASYNKTDVVTAGKLKSTDGTAGIRFAHNTDALVTDFKVTKQ
ncbi:MAG TPA: hypothetical protein VGN16_07610 [Acidobacteriaceae bacterium]|jgi:hypothetical protein